MSNDINKILEKVRKRAEGFVAMRVSIDFGNRPHPESGLPMAHHAAIHEFGTKTIPARPALDRAAKAAAPSLKDLSRVAAKEMVNGKDPAAALVPVAEALNRATVESYESARDWAKPLAESTKKAKGSDKPLDDTHALIDSVGWVIRDKRGRIAARGKVK